MGRFNHENDVALPGFDGVAVLSGDDTFSTTPASSQLYLYTAAGRDALWNDKGTLHAFVADDTSKNDYFDVQPGRRRSPARSWPCRRRSRPARRRTATDLLSTDVPGVPAPPAGIPDGPQWVLDQWGNKSVTPSLPNDVFDFIRIEDTAYDKRPGMSNVVYLADSGRGTAGAGEPADHVDERAHLEARARPEQPAEGEAVDPRPGRRQPGQDARRDPPAGQPRDDGERQPASSQEDPGSSQQFALPTVDPNATTARIWRVPLARRVAGGRREGRPVRRRGADRRRSRQARRTSASWESSGIVDASAVFGPGMFLVDVQANTLWVEKADGPRRGRAGRPGLDVQARGRSAAADEDPGRLSARLGGLDAGVASAAPAPSSAGAVARRARDGGVQPADELERLPGLDEPRRARRARRRASSRRPAGRVRSRIASCDGGRDRLVLRPELLVQLLAGARADELDLDVLARAPCPRAGSSSPARSTMRTGSPMSST